MATVNVFKFFGVDNVTSTDAQTMFGTTTINGVATQNPLVNETYIVKSLRVTNKSGSNTPTVTIKNNAFEIVNTQTLVAATSVEILTLPLIVEGGTVLSYTTAGTVSDGVVFGISYLNILKEKID